jgi:hypothetical protein
MFVGLQTQRKEIVLHVLSTMPMDSCTLPPSFFDLEMI